MFLPKVEEIGDYFLTGNESLKMLNLPSAKYIGRNALKTNKKLRILNIPCIELIGPGFLCANRRLKIKYSLGFIDNVRVDTYDQVNHGSDRTIKISVKRYK